MMNPTTHRIAAPVALLLCISSATLADPPPDYYDSVDASNSTTLRVTLHEAIDDHQRFPYTSSSTDTWDILNQADSDPNDSGNILDVYRNASYPKINGGVRDYNREHTWPKSYGFPDNTSNNYPYTDCHMLSLCDGGYNSSRSNNPYRDCNAGCSERTTLANNGQGGGSGEYPGNSNWRTGSGSGGTWETWIGRRGDVARALLYADIRYEGGTHGGTGHSEPDLILTDDGNLIVTSSDNEPVAHMGMLSVLLQWHVEDPVDDLELNRNDVVFSFQNNRNPFIDNPEWVACLFLDECDAACPQDLDGDGQVEAFDLAILLGSWGPCEGCPTDFNGDRVVDAFDLAQVLGAWGLCP
ncbi:MAG: endonuclease [Planctomycetota bacterium]|nr:endonuclease [Planctomycetota bacterium]